MSCSVCISKHEISVREEFLSREAANENALCIAGIGTNNAGRGGGGYGNTWRQANEAAQRAPHLNVA